MVINYRIFVHLYSFLTHYFVLYISDIMFNVVYNSFDIKIFNDIAYSNKDIIYFSLAEVWISINIY